MWTYLLGLGAAACFGVAAVMQQRVAFRAPPERVLRLRLLLWLVRRPRWLAGLGVALVANLLSLGALAQGPVAVVEPLQVCQLLFALPLAAIWGHHRVSPRDWAGAWATAGGLAVFLIAADPHQGDVGAATTGGWILTGALVGGLAFGVAWGSRRLVPIRRAPLLAAAAGVLSATQAALTSSADRFVMSHGLLPTMLSWHPYAVVAAAVAVAVLAQSAYEMAPLPASLPAALSTEPLTGIAIGVGLLGGTMRVTPLALVGELLGLAIMITGVRLLATSPLVTGQVSRLRERQAQGRLSRLEDELHHDLERLRADLPSSRAAGPWSSRLSRHRLHRHLDRAVTELARIADEGTRLEARSPAGGAAALGQGPRQSRTAGADELGDDAVPEDELLATRHALHARARDLRAQADWLLAEARRVLESGG